MDSKEIREIIKYGFSEFNNFEQVWQKSNWLCNEWLKQDAQLDIFFKAFETINDTSDINEIYFIIEKSLKALSEQADKNAGKIKKDKKDGKAKKM